MTPAAEAFCCDCPSTGCSRRVGAAGDTFCTPGRACTEWVAGRLCPHSECIAYDDDMASCRNARAGSLACEWQPDGGKNVTAADGSSVYVPKCGLGSVGKHECAVRCGSPPTPGCSASTNWWDLFEDTSQHVVARATCDDSVCPYPLGEQPDGKPVGRCNPYPFTCCDESRGVCFAWDGMDVSKCPNVGLRFIGWEAEKQCDAACSERN